MTPDFTSLGLSVAYARPLSGGDTCRAWRLRLTDGASVFVKQAPSGAVGMAPLEADGLRWLGDNGVRVPEVLAVGDSLLALSWVNSGRPTPAAAAALGRDLATLHSRSAAFFGCPPPGQPAAREGWVGAVRVPFADSPGRPASGRGGDVADWAEFYVNRRLMPAAERAQRVGGLTDRTRRPIDDLCDALLSRPQTVAGPAVAPAPIHGDLWSGNVMWQDDGAVLIDPSAVGGHPETDLAMLHLFGLPHLETALAAYESVRRMAADWRDRIPLHQVFPLLVHAVMFGSGYGAQAADAAERALWASH